MFNSPEGWECVACGHWWLQKLSGLTVFAWGAVFWFTKCFNHVVACSSSLFRALVDRFQTEYRKHYSKCTKCKLRQLLFWFDGPMQLTRNNLPSCVWGILLSIAAKKNGHCAASRSGWTAQRKALFFNLFIFSWAQLPAPSHDIIPLFRWPSTG